jgi:transposase
MNRLASGVDMSKASFVGAVWLGGQAVELGEFANNQEGFERLQQALLAHQGQQGASQIHLHPEGTREPTGGYELGLVAFAYEQGWAVSLPNPRQVREWAKGMGKRAKTAPRGHPVDAKLLAQFAAQRQPPTQPPLAAEVSELDNLLARRHDLETMLRQEQNRLGELTDRPGVPQSVQTNLAQVIRALEQAVQEIEAAIEQHLQQHAYLQEHRRRLLTIPGIGPKTVLPLLVLLLRCGDPLGALTDGQGSDKGLTALVGLDPTPHASGTSVHQRPTISKMGDGEIRRLLYMGALGALRGQNPLHDFYDRLVGRGKAKKLALVAASRKLLTWAWAIFATGAVWNPPLPAI